MTTPRSPSSRNSNQRGETRRRKTCRRKTANGPGANGEQRPCPREVRGVRRHRVDAGDQSRRRGSGLGAVGVRSWADFSAIRSAAARNQVATVVGAVDGA